jgi:glycosyltransferase involved in cell wall biosynthesis
MHVLSYKPESATRASAGRLRALHLYSGNMYGGVETVLATLARLRHLVREMEPGFGLCYRGRLWDELTKAGSAVFDLGPVRLSRPWTVWRARRRLGKVLRESGYEVVVCHCAWPVAVFGPAIRRYRRGLVYWAHDAGLTPDSRVGRRNWLEWLGSWSPPELTVAISRFTEPFARRVFPGARCATLLSPVALAPVANRQTARARVREELGVGPDDVVIVTVCRLVEYKGHRLLLEALKLLRNVPGWVWWVAGGAEQPFERVFRDELGTAVRQAGIVDRVRFLGARNDVPQLLAGADIHCQPNLGPELFGLAFVEALAAGLPVVTTRLGAAEEILDGGAGVLLPPGDPAALAGALAGLIADRAERARFASSGSRRAAELCDPARQLPALAELLQTVRAVAPGNACVGSSWEQQR